MAIIGHETNRNERILFTVLAIVAALLCAAQFRLIYSMKLFTVVLLPFISFCICFENVLMAYGNDINKSSLTAVFGNIFQSFEIPLMIIVLYETSYRLFEIRKAHFICIAFDQGSDISKILANSTIWFVRLVACGLYIMNMFVDFRREPTGRGGYVYMDNNRNDHHKYIWLDLIPPIILSFVAIIVSFVTARYGNNVTISLSSRYRWRCLFVCTIFQIVGEIFPLNQYPLTSNCGELILLIGITYTTFLIEEDLALTGTFADYLHRSNIAFDNKLAIDKTGHIEVPRASEDLAEEGVGGGVELTAVTPTASKSKHNSEQHNGNGAAAAASIKL